MHGTRERWQSTAAFLLGAFMLMFETLATDRPSTALVLVGAGLVGMQSITLWTKGKDE